MIFPYNFYAQNSDLWLQPVDRNSEPFTFTCMYEDSRGWIWFGLYAGIFMYDGLEYTHFQYDPKKSESLSDNKVTSLLEDNTGNIWIGTQNGLNIYDVRKGVIKRCTELNALSNTLKISGLSKDKLGNIFIATNIGLYKWSQRNSGSKNNVYNFFLIYKMFVFNILHINNDIYFNDDFGLQHINISTGHISILKDSIFIKEVGSIKTLRKDAVDCIWIGCEKGLFSYNPKTGKWNTYYEMNNENINFIVPKDNRYLWVGTASGLFLTDTYTGNTIKQAVQFSSEKKLANETFTDCLQLSSKETWFCIGQASFYKYEPQRRHLKKIQIDLVGHLLSVVQLFEIYEYEPHSLLIPSGKGHKLINWQTKSEIPFPYQPSYSQKGWKNGATCFYEEKGGRLWIGTTEGVLLFDKNKKCFLPIEPWMEQNESIRSGLVRKIHLDSKGYLWIAFWAGGVCKVSFMEKKVFAYKKWRGIGDNSRYIMEDRTGTIWIGTRGGLAKYIESADTFKIYTHNPSDPESISDNTVFCIHEDKEGNIWCGTFGGGLNRLNIKTDKFTRYTTSDGLSDNTVLSIFEDHSNRLWMSTFKGLSYFDVSNNTFQKISSDQGLLSNGYVTFLYGRSNDSTLLFYGSYKGIDYFNPDSIRLSSYEPPVYFTDFKLFNQSVPVSIEKQSSDTFQLAEHISFAKVLTLRYDQNILTFTYAALDYSSPAMVQYAYRLIGFDSAWQYVGNRRDITFTNLDPGRYMLEVKATNGDGVWGTKHATLAIHILPPWWRTWAFQLSALSVFLLSLYGLYRFRIRQIKDREMLRRRLSEVQTEALRAQMNPHFIYNCLSSLKLHIERNDNDKASYYIDCFASLLRRVLAHSRADLIPLNDEIETLRLYVELEKMRFKDNFVYQFQIDPEAPLDELEVPPLLLQPYVENAIQHGLWHKKDGQGRLEIRVERFKENLQICIEDNGIGRMAASQIKYKRVGQHESQGLNLTQERIKHYNTFATTQLASETFDLKTANGLPIGTRVSLTFQSLPEL